MSTAHQARLADTELSDEWDFKIPKASLYCMVCGWTGAANQSFHGLEGNTIQCPTCKDQGKIEPPSSITDRKHMTSKTSKETIRGRQKIRQKLGKAAPDWLREIEQAILRSKTRGDQQ